MKVRTFAALSVVAVAALANLAAIDVASAAAVSAKHHNYVRSVPSFELGSSDRQVSRSEMPALPERTGPKIQE